MFLRLILIGILVAAISGCATSQKNTTSPQIEEFNVRINDLEKQLQEKDSEIRDLEERLSKVQNADGFVNAAEVDISKVTPMQIQATLKSAGFYTEAIDGKVGRKTKDAIKAFQRANGLKADGVVGRQTWSKLQKYME